MGLFDGRSYSASDAANLRPPSSARYRGASPARNGFYVRPSAARSSSSLFNGGGGGGGSGDNRNYGSTGSRGIFSFGGNSGGSSSSYYRRRPRDGYISYLMHKLQRMIKELWYYAKKNPVKAFFAVVVPLLSAGGAIHGLLRQLGVRLPMMDGATRRSGGGYYGSSGYGGARSSAGGPGGEGPGWMENAGSLMQIARAFV